MKRLVKDLLVITGQSLLYLEVSFIIAGVIVVVIEYGTR